MIRRRIIYGEAFEGYAVNFLREHYWKVQHLFTWEEALQELRAKFCQCREKYKDVLDGPNHLMGLYKTSCFNWLVTHARKDTDFREFFDVDADADAMLNYRNPSESDNEGIALVMLSNVPKDIAQVFSILATAPEEVIEMVSLAIRTNKKSRIANKTICSMIGEDHKSLNMIQRIRSYFSPQ